MADNAHGTQAVSQTELDRAHRFWGDFTKLTTYGILAVVAILVLMAVFLV